ncbi:MAG: 6-carboxytetrahydropterin synthase [Cytophagales bacterium]|nr:6-carboxytetrahydropterin synthase [Cytophagales bacterium]
MTANLEISQRFYFDAAHRLQREIETEGSRRIHGHTYHAEIAIRGAVNPATGMVMDLGLIRREIEKLRTRLDHHFLDEVPELGIPTLENLCVFIEKTMRGFGLSVTRVSVWRDALGDRCDLRLQ